MHAFRNRIDAGQQLAAALTRYRNRTDVICLGLPRGGVPVANEVARALRVALDVLIVRKLGDPLQPEFALGAIASGGVVVLNDDLPEEWLAPAVIDPVMAREYRELERREQLYRSGAAPLELRDKTVLLVDDGAATGSTLLAAVRAARQLGARSIVVAVPVASIEAATKLRDEASSVVCLGTPASFTSVGAWYVDFPQCTDDEVRDTLARA